MRKTPKEFCKTPRLWAVPSVQSVVAASIATRRMTMMEGRPIFFLNGCHCADFQMVLVLLKWINSFLELLLLKITPSTLSKGDPWGVECC